MAMATAVAKHAILMVSQPIPATAATNTPKPTLRANTAKKAFQTFRIASVVMPMDVSTMAVKAAGMIRWKSVTLLA
jgi:hypothetical protein